MHFNEVGSPTASVFPGGLVRFLSPGKRIPARPGRISPLSYLGCCLGFSRQRSGRGGVSLGVARKFPHTPISELIHLFCRPDLGVPQIGVFGLADALMVIATRPIGGNRDISPCTENKKDVEPPVECRIRRALNLFCLTKRIRLQCIPNRK